MQADKQVWNFETKKTISVAFGHIQKPVCAHSTVIVLGPMSLWLTVHITKPSSSSPFLFSFPLYFWNRKN